MLTSTTLHPPVCMHRPVCTNIPVCMHRPVCTHITGLITLFKALGRRSSNWERFYSMDDCWEHLLRSGHYTRKCLVRNSLTTDWVTIPKTYNCLLHIISFSSMILWIYYSSNLFNRFPVCKHRNNCMYVCVCVCVCVCVYVCVCLNC